MYLQDVEILKEIPGYKALLKAVIKSQIQMLVEQLSDQTGEESLILTASTLDGSLSHLGSVSGKDFLDGRDEIKSQFLSHCLKKMSKRVGSDIEGTTKRARYSETNTMEELESDIPYHEQDHSLHFDPLYSSHAQAASEWEAPPNIDPSDYETSTGSGGKMVVRKKRFKATPSTSQSGRVKESGKGGNKAAAKGVKVGGPEADEENHTEIDSVSNRTGIETEMTEPGPAISDTSLDQQTIVKVEAEDTESGDGSVVTGGAEGMDSSFDQSFQQDDSFLNPNSSSGDLSYTQTAFVDRVPLAVMNTREQGPSVLNRNTLCVRRGNQNMHVKSRNKLNEISQQKQCGMVFKKFPCLVCGKLFFQKSDVKRHEVVHTGQKFPCSYCPKQFSQKHGRNLHEKAHQIETDALSSNMFNGR